MTLLDDMPSKTSSSSPFRLAPGVESVLAESAITLAELYRVLTRPAHVSPDGRGARRYTGWGLCVIVNDGTVEKVMIDGADRTNWEAWAAERAQFGDSDAREADEALAGAARAFERSLAAQKASQQRQRRPRRVTAGPVTVRRIEPALPLAPEPVIEPERVVVRPARAGVDILAGIHPKLRLEVTLLAAGDYSRIVIHSPTKITINPPA